MTERTETVPTPPATDLAPATPPTPDGCGPAAPLVTKLGEAADALMRELRACRPHMNDGAMRARALDILVELALGLDDELEGIAAETR